MAMDDDFDVDDALGEVEEEAEKGFGKAAGEGFYQWISRSAARAAKSGVGAAEALVDYGIALARGHRLLLVGPEDAGKSSFARYVKRGELLPQGNRAHTLRTIKNRLVIRRYSGDVKSSSPIQKLRLRWIAHGEGNIPAEGQAKLVEDHRPDVVVVMLDLTRAIEDSAGWFHGFWSELQRVAQGEAGKSLRVLIVVLNKLDSATPATLEQLRQKIEGTIAGRSVGQIFASAIQIKPAITIRGTRQTKRARELLDQILEEISLGFGLKDF